MMTKWRDLEQRLQGRFIIVCATGMGKVHLNDKITVQYMNIV